MTEGEVLQMAEYKLTDMINQPFYWETRSSLSQSSLFGIKKLVRYEVLEITKYSNTLRTLITHSNAQDQIVNRKESKFVIGIEETILPYLAKIERFKTASKPC